MRNINRRQNIATFRRQRPARPVARPVSKPPSRRAPKPR